MKFMEASIREAPMDSMIQYNAACFYSLAGEIEKSIDCLKNCIFKIGIVNREWLAHDSDLDNVRADPRFAKIVKAFPD